MAHALIFNPQNDIALGMDCAHLTPPRQAALLARHAAALMCELAREEDTVLLPRPSDEAEDQALHRWLDKTKPRCRVAERAVTGEVGLPWGWSADAARLLRHAGATVPCEIDQLLPQMRMLSHRRTATKVNELLQRAINWGKGHNPVPKAAQECESADHAVRVIEELGENCFVKSPWSSSGREVWHTSGVPQSVIKQRIEGAIRRQGSVMIEVAHRKRADFAMLFSTAPVVDGIGVSEGRFRFRGYSLFTTHHTTAYAGNLVASDARLEQKLTNEFGADRHLLCLLREALEEILNELLWPLAATDEPMFAGVDMMVSDSGTIVPCIEVNLRLTMGFVALALRRHLPLLSAPTLTFSISSLPSHSTLSAINLIPENPYFSAKLTPFF